MCVLVSPTTVKDFLIPLHLVVQVPFRMDWGESAVFTYALTQILIQVWVRVCVYVHGFLARTEVCSCFFPVFNSKSSSGTQLTMANFRGSTHTHTLLPHTGWRVIWSCLHTMSGYPLCGRLCICVVLCVCLCVWGYSIFGYCYINSQTKTHTRGWC